MTLPALIPTRFGTVAVTRTEDDFILIGAASLRTARDGRVVASLGFNLRTDNVWALHHASISAERDGSRVAARTSRDITAALTEALREFVDEDVAN